MWALRTVLTAAILFHFHLITREIHMGDFHGIEDFHESLGLPWFFGFTQIVMFFVVSINISLGVSSFTGLMLTITFSSYLELNTLGSRDVQTVKSELGNLRYMLFS